MRTSVTISGSPLSSHLKALVRAAVTQTLKQVPAKALKNFPQPIALHLAIVSSTVSRKLNAQYRKKDRPTDVLSFPSLNAEKFPGEETSSLGELAICLPVAKAQAKEYGESLGQELQRLTVHGVLHLLGYDHELGDREARRMFRLQDKVLQALSKKHLRS